MEQDVHKSYKEGTLLREEISQWQLKGLLDYWLEVHPKNGFPSRTDIDPIRMPRILPFITMTNVERDPFRLRFRLVGTAVNAAFGEEFTGKYFDDVFPNFSSSVGYLQRKQVVDEGIPIHYRGQGTLRYNLEFKSVEWILLPLASDGKNVDIIISAISYGGE